jgi:hypothetical protein
MRASMSEVFGTRVSRCCESPGRRGVVAGATERLRLVLLRAGIALPQSGADREDCGLTGSGNGSHASPTCSGASVAGRLEPAALFNNPRRRLDRSASRFSGSTEFAIAAEDKTHDLRLVLNDDKFSVPRPITERWHAIHITFPFRGSDLVADALADDVALELRADSRCRRGGSRRRHG